MDGGYKGWNPYIERHLAIFVNYLQHHRNTVLFGAALKVGENRLYLDSKNSSTVKLISLAICRNNLGAISRPL